MCNGLQVMTDAEKEPQNQTKTKTLQAKRTNMTKTNTKARRTNKTETNTKAQRTDKTKTDTKKRAREIEEGALDLFLALTSKRSRR